jgi:hypothetical protein
MNLNSIALDYVHNVRHKAQDELNWFTQQPTLGRAIEYAALAINKKRRKYRHQWRLKNISLEAARQILIKNCDAISKSNDFDDLFTLVEELCKPIKGIGELYIYDTSLRIAARLHIMPRKVYLHAGTRAGARALGLDINAKALELSRIPLELRKLEPHEIEDVLCIYKDYFSKPGEKYAKHDLIKRSWCG